MELAIFLMANSIAYPINNVVAGLKDAVEREGDLAKRLDIESRNEVCKLSTWFNVFIEKVPLIITDVSANVDQLSKSSHSLSEISGQISSGAEQTTLRVRSVSQSSEEMSTNMNSLAATIEQATTNVQLVASAAEETTATINEILGNVAQGNSAATAIVDEIAEVTHASDEMSSSSFPAI